MERKGTDSSGGESYGLPAVLDVAAASAFLGVNRKTIYAAIGRFQDSCRLGLSHAA